MSYCSRKVTCWAIHLQLYSIINIPFIIKMVSLAYGGERLSSQYSNRTILVNKPTNNGQMNRNQST